MGWDKDQDGFYPPNDADDVAVLDGEDTLNAVFDNSTDEHDYIEFAHLTAKDYTNSGGGNIASFLKLAGDSLTTHIYMHDIKFDSISDNSPALGAWSAIVSSQTDGAGVQHLAIENTHATNERSLALIYYENQNTNIRIKNNTVEAFGNNGDVFSVVEMFDASFVEIDGNVIINDNLLDVSAKSNGLVILECSQNMIITNNDIENFSYGVTIGPYVNQPCDTARRIDEILIDRNYIYVKHPSSALSGVSLGDITDATYGQLLYASKNFTVTNNIISGADIEGDICISLGASATNAPMDGTITTVGNTCYGFGEGVGVWLQNAANPQNNHIIQNNLIVTTSATSYHMRVEYDVTNMISNNNVFAGFPGLFEYDFGGDLNLAAWTAATFTNTEDNNSTECTPAFVAAANLDFHLLPSDTCANQGGADVSTVTTVDYDNEVRGAGVGADEK